MNITARLKWTRALGLALVAGLLLALYAPTFGNVAVAQAQPAAEVTAPRLNIRSGPGASYASLTTVGQGEVVTLLGRDSASAWAKVRTASGVEGWAGTALIDPSVSLSTLPVLERVQPQVAVEPARLNVRLGPGAGYPVVTSLGQGSIVNIVGRSTDQAWLYVHFGGNALGWIASGEVTPQIALGWLPVMDAAAQTGGPTPLPPAAPAATPALARGVTGTARSGFPPVRVNTAAGDDHGTITTLNAGEQVQILGRAAELPWYYIFFRGDTVGWVDSSDIVTSASQAAIPVVPQTLPVGEDQVPPSGAGAPPVSGQVGTVTAYRLNVRSGPGPGYEVLDVVTRGQVLPILGRDSAGSWLRVQLPGGRTGWVSALYVDEAGIVARVPVQAPARATAVVTTGALNIRRGPGPQYAPVTLARQGDLITLTGRIPSGEWVKVVANGREGWVDASFIETGASIQGLPVFTASAGDF